MEEHGTPFLNRLLRHAAPATGAPVPSANAVNELAELVVDLIEGTGLVPADRLVAARRRAGAG